MGLCGNESFWDWQQLHNSTWPRIPRCFQETLLVYLPSGFLWLSAPVYLTYLAITRRCTNVPNSNMSMTKTVFSLLLVIITMATTLKDVALSALAPDQVEHTNLETVHYVAQGVSITTFVFTAILVQLERSYCVITSGVLFVYWLLMTITSIVPLYTSIEKELYTDDPPQFVLIAFIFLLVIIQFLLHCPSDLKLRGSFAYCNRSICPELTASFLSKLTFFWITKLILTGYNRPLQASDLWPLNPRDEGETVQDKFNGIWHWTHQRKRKNHCFATRNKNPNQLDCGCHDDSSNESNEYSPLLSSCQSGNTIDSALSKDLRSTFHSNLIWALVQAFGCSVGLSYLLKFVSDTLQFIAPFILKELIVFIENKDVRPLWQGFFLAATMLVTSLLQTVFYHQHYHLAMTAGMRMKSALMAAIYKKSLSQTICARGRYSLGEVINLMSVDCQRIQDVMSYTWMVWSLPYQVSLAVYLLWGLLGAPVLAGLILLLLLVPVNGAMAYAQQRLQRSNLIWKGRRIRMLSEVLSGIKVLKLYAWEDTFLNKILFLRSKEVVILTRLAWINASGILVWTCAPYLVCLASFGAFVLFTPSGILTADMAFVTLSLFNILQFPIAFIPEMVSFTAQAKVSIKRIEEYLCEEELQDHKDNTWNNLKTDDSDAAIRLSKAAFTWNTGSAFKLYGLNIEISKGRLVAVVGPVCSGKSSLLSALMGEMHLLQGGVSVKGSIAYVPQEAWLQNASIKDNILFGSAFNAKKYQKVIESCALVSDLDTLPHGDNMEIGENGINLSGGQKQRISIARAIYSESDIFIFDDPLSAVDTRVGKHLFKKVISSKGCLKRKTRVFVTHAVHWLPLVDFILVMQDGRLVEYGTYGNLIGRDGPLTQFLFSSLKKDMDDNEFSQKGDEEILEIKRRMWEHVESATSQSDATTSGDDVNLRYRQFQLINVVAGTSSSQELSSSSSKVTTAINSSDAREVVDRTNKLRTVNDETTPLQPTANECLHQGNVKLSVYKQYCKNVGICSTILIIVLFALYQTSSVLANAWLSNWTDDPSYKSINRTTSEIQQDNIQYLKIYGALGAGQVISICIYACIASLRMVAASSIMHAAMLRKVIGAPMRFFDTAPTGRLLNRFSRDVEMLDNNLPQIFFMWIMCVFSVLATLVVVSVETPIFVAVVVPLIAIYWAIQRFFVPTSRQLKRLAATTRSPVFSQFSETLTGCHVIRAYHRQNSFMTTFLSKLDKNVVMYFAGITANRWLGVWIEAVSTLVVLAASVFSLITPGISGATLGLSLTYALQITQALKWLVRTMSDIESTSVSVERVHEYSLLEQEIAIVGRTGAGKSSLTLALFRILEANEGHIYIDGINIADICLPALRSKLTILPQDPIILSGSLRMNLDPKEQYTDDDLWRALTLAHLKDTTLIMSDGLESDVGENGARLSVGQRQLLCLARALLRQTKILIMDEPTACVDMDTDALVQHTIMTAFSDCTIITIAHRIQSILNYDRVMVLQGGHIVEFDAPLKLLKDPKGVFAMLGQSAGYRHGEVL